MDNPKTTGTCIGVILGVFVLFPLCLLSPVWIYDAGGDPGTVFMVVVIGIMAWFVITTSKK
jgi:hypothetical protein